MVTGSDAVCASMSPAAWHLLTECVATLAESGRAPAVKIAAAVHGATVEVWATVCGLSITPDGAAELLVMFGDDSDPVTVPAAGVVGVDWP